MRVEQLPQLLWGTLISLYRALSGVRTRGWGPKRHLFIGGAWFGDEEAEELGAMLAQNTSLESLNLSCNVGARGLRGIAEALSINKTLHILRIENWGDTGVDIMADVLASTSSSLREVTLLSCACGLLGSQNISCALKTNTCLKMLTLNHDKIGDAGATALADALASNSSLDQIRLYECAIGAIGTLEIAAALQKNTCLKILGLNNNDKIGDDGATALAHALSSNSSLATMYLDDCGIGATGSRAIADALETNTCLQAITLNDNEKIGDIGATALAEALSSNSSLISIDMVKCSIGATGSRAIADALETNTCLEALGLRCNKIGDAGATALAHALSSNSSLISIDMVKCSIGATGSRAIADALETNTCLEVLDLERNKIGDAGATALAHALASTTSLKNLVLDDCGIGDHGMSALIEAWGTNLALPVDFHAAIFDSDFDAETFEAAVEVGISWDYESLHDVMLIRDAVLRKRELLLAFGMAMVSRLGGGPRAHIHSATTFSGHFSFFGLTSTRERSAFHYMNSDVFKLVGEAYGAY